MVTFAEQKNTADDPNKVRKALEGMFVLRKKDPMVSLPEALADADGNPIDLSSQGFFYVGLVTTDGYSLSRGRETSGVEAHGYADEVRMDTVRSPKSITATALESDKKSLLEAVLGMNLAGVKALPTGEVTFDEVSIPLDFEYEGILIVRDVNKAEGKDQFRGYGFPRLSLTGDSEETLNAEDARTTPLEFTVMTDAELGTPVRHYFFGAGYNAVAHGFESAGA